MDTKNVLVFLAGAAVAYFVIKQMDKKKPIATTTTPPVTDPKLVACQTALNDALLTVRTTDIEGFKAQFMADCMAVSASSTPNAPTGVDQGIDETTMTNQANTSLQNELGL